MEPLSITPNRRRPTRGHPALAARRPLARATALLGLLLLLLLPAWRAAAQCSAPTGLTASNVRGTTATLTFAGPAAATAYAVSYTYVGGSTGGTVQPNPTRSPVNLTGLPASSIVTASVIAVCGGGQFSPAATVTFVTGPLNDEPCGAVALPLGNPGTGGTTFGATATGAAGVSANGCGGVGPLQDVWFAYTTPASGPGSTGVDLATNQDQVRRVVELFAAPTCTGAFSSLGCSDFASNGLRVGGLAPGTTYYARVATYNQSDPQGLFTLTATPPTGCGPVNNLALGTVAATSATVSFQAGVNNGNYTVYVQNPLTLATLQTVPATGSPVTVTGLAPLTDYRIQVQSNCGAAGTSNPSPSLTFRTANGNDEPATAAPLAVNATCQPTTSTGLLATTTVPSGYANPGCNGVAQPADVWFRFVTPATGAGATGVTATVTGFGANQVRLFAAPNGAAGPFAELGCATATDTGGPAPPLEVAGLAPNTAYFLSVASRAAGGGTDFTICLTPAPACPTPVRLAATAIGTTSAQLNWTLFGPTAGTYAVEYGPQGFAPGTGAAGVVRVANISALTYTATALTPNTRYDFYVTRDCGAAGNGSSARSGQGRFRTLNVAPPANDNPCAATRLPFSGATCASPTPGTTAGATNSNVRQPNGQPSCADYGADVWYAYTTPASGPGSTAVALELVGNGTRGLALWSAPACTGPFGPIVGQVCPASGGTGPVSPLLATGLTPSTVYYVQVGADPNDPAASFTLCARTATGCNAVTVGGLRGFGQVASPNNTLELFFDPVAGATSYTVVVTGPNGFSQTYPVAASVPPGIVVLGGLTARTTYTVQVVTNCPAGQSGAFTLTGTTAVAPPANDLCSGAFPISCGQRKRVILTGATSVGDPTNCGGTDQAVFYKFVGTGDSVLVSTCYNSNNNTAGYPKFYQGSCANLTCTSVSNRILCPLPQFFGRRFDAYFKTDQGVDYYFVFQQDQGGAGYNDSIAVSMTCISSPCPTVGGLTVRNLTATTASVGFVPAAGSSAPGYTVRATPTGGGSPITASGATSPLPLTGLSPNTAYALTVLANCTATTSSAPSAALAIRTPLPVRNAALAATLGLYPNPAHHAATLVVPAALLRQAALLTLTDGLGRAVQQRFVSAAAGTAAESRTELDLRGLPPGLYVLRLLSSVGPLTRQLVLE